eukprot:IDg23383t1
MDLKQKIAQQPRKQGGACRLHRRTLGCRSWALGWSFEIKGLCTSRVCTALEVPVVRLRAAFNWEQFKMNDSDATITHSNRSVSPGSLHYSSSRFVAAFANAAVHAGFGQAVDIAALSVLAISDSARSMKMTSCIGFRTIPQISCVLGRVKASYQ